MFETTKRIRLLGITLFGLSIAAYAEELLVWQVPEAKKMPTFYHEASRTSKPVSFLKPGQIIQILSKQKDWAKVNTLDNSGQIAWVPMNEIKDATKLTIALKQDANAYQCQVRIRDPEGREVGSWRLANSWGFDEKDTSDKEMLVNALDQLEETFTQQQATLANIVNHLFLKPIEKAKEVDSALKTHSVGEGAALSETKHEEKKSVTVKKEQLS